MPSLNPRENIETDLAGRRDSSAMRRAAERMDRMREELRQRVGNVHLAVPLAREARVEQ